MEKGKEREMKLFFMIDLSLPLKQNQQTAAFGLPTAKFQPLCQVRTGASVNCVGVSSVSLLSAVHAQLPLVVAGSASSFQLNVVQRYFGLFMLFHSPFGKDYVPHSCGTHTECIGHISGEIRIKSTLIDPILNV